MQETMTKTFQRPLAHIDIEATGLDMVRDRIVSLGLRIDGETNGPLKQIFIFNPGIPISPEATAVHGYTDQMVKDEPKFSDRAKQIELLLKGCDLAGFNLINFDIPMLWEEF